jgi:hypothetical protein
LPSSKQRLTRHHLPHFSGDTLFDAVARAVCEAECLPRKELYESWEVASRIRRRVRGRPILELAAGHGLVSLLLLLLDPDTPGAVCVDRRKPDSADRIATSLVARWPRLRGGVRWEERDLTRVAVRPSQLVVAVHACGTLTDSAIHTAVTARAALAVLPCCQDGAQSLTRTAGLEAWMDVRLAVDAVRVMRLHASGYGLYLRTIPEAITPMNRLIIGLPPTAPEAAPQMCAQAEPQWADRP